MKLTHEDLAWMEKHRRKIVLGVRCLGALIFFAAMRGAFMHAGAFALGALSVLGFGLASRFGGSDY